MAGLSSNRSSGSNHHLAQAGPSQTMAAQHDRPSYRLPPLEASKASSPSPHAVSRFDNGHHEYASTSTSSSPANGRRHLDHNQQQPHPHPAFHLPGIASLNYPPHHSQQQSAPSSRHVSYDSPPTAVRHRATESPPPPSRHPDSAFLHPSYGQRAVTPPVAGRLPMSESAPYGGVSANRSPGECRGLA